MLWSLVGCFNWDFFLSSFVFVLLVHKCCKVIFYFVSSAGEKISFFICKFKSHAPCTAHTRRNVPRMAWTLCCNFNKNFKLYTHFIPKNWNWSEFKSKIVQIELIYNWNRFGFSSWCLFWFINMQQLTPLNDFLGYEMRQNISITFSCVCSSFFCFSFLCIGSNSFICSDSAMCHDRKKSLWFHYNGT